MTDRFWFALNEGKFLADTMHLTPSEFGCYVRLIFHAYNHGGEIPTEPKRLAQITGAGRRWRSQSGVVLCFFKSQLGEQVLRHTKVIDELQRSSEISSKRSAAGKAGNEKRWGNRSQTRSQTASPSDRIYNTSQRKKEPHTAVARPNGSGGGGSLSLEEQDRLIAAYERQHGGRSWQETSHLSDGMSPEKRR